jgi:hypothetical protein
MCRSDAAVVEEETIFSGTIRYFVLLFVVDKLLNRNAGNFPFNAQLNAFWIVNNLGKIEIEDKKDGEKQVSVPEWASLE